MINLILVIIISLVKMSQENENGWITGKNGRESNSNCDFPQTPVFGEIDIGKDPAQCGSECSRNLNCTHWELTGFICRLKSGYIHKDYVKFYPSNSNKKCGIVRYGIIKALIYNY